MVLVLFIHRDIALIDHKITDIARNVDDSTKVQVNFMRTVFNIFGVNVK